MAVLPWQVFRSPWTHRSLLKVMIKRDVLGRYKGSAMGLLWSLFNPILTLVVYTLVFGGLMKLPVGRAGAAGGTRSYAVFLFSGMIVYLLFAECTNRSATLIVQHANYVKRVVFPLEILPWMTLGSAAFHFLISMGVLVLASLLLTQRVAWTLVFFPLPMICLAMFIIGLTLFLSSLGVYLRDIAPTVAVITNLMLFLSPVLYDIQQFRSNPKVYYLFHLNPLTFIIQQMRGLVIEGWWPDIRGLTLYFVGATLFAWVGLVWFQKTRKGFADVL